MAIRRLRRRMLVKRRYRQSMMTVSHSGKMGCPLSSLFSGHLGLYGSVPFGLHWSRLKFTPAIKHIEANHCWAVPAELPYLAQLIIDSTIRVWKKLKFLVGSEWMTQSYIYGCCEAEDWLTPAQVFFLPIKTVTRCTPIELLKETNLLGGRQLFEMLVTAAFWEQESRSTGIRVLWN